MDKGLKGHQIIGELRLQRGEPIGYGISLKGHQIIGELRPIHAVFAASLMFIERSPDHWWVTTYRLLSKYYKQYIERSPDHWWVTTTRRLLHLIISLDWKVTRSLVSYDFVRSNCELLQLNWKVTRSLVSYDKSSACNKILLRLKGHQIIGELRLDLPLILLLWLLIERSPDHWWVTTCRFLFGSQP